MTTAASTMELPKSYVPAEHEARIRARWEASDTFHAEPLRPGDPEEPYCILIPPPNVTAPLHLGHAFNNTIQDVLIRHHRMRGYRTLWMPGTDHAGIATQTVVERRLLAQGKKRLDFKREEFVAKVHEWKDRYEATITDQLKAIGSSCDWDRQRFTMDAMCANAVREAFFRLFRQGLVYRGKRLVNWDPVTLTALADDEVEMQEVQGHMWYLRYPVVGGDGSITEYLTVATTRPETMLGDTAVAVNPKDPRAPGLRGKMVRLPIVNRLIPIIEDDYVLMPASLGGTSKDAKAEWTTGFLKVTPAHDPNDWDLGQRHHLKVINVMAPDASISDQLGWHDGGAEARPFVGLTREAARAAIVSWFESHDLLEDTREYVHAVGHSYRSHVPIEPYLSDQWYMKVTDDQLVGEAQRALSEAQFEGPRPRRESARGSSRMGDGEIEFYPARYAKTYQAWHQNLRDWCISRQLWWGHRIPVWKSTQISRRKTKPGTEAAAAFQSLLSEWEAAGRAASQPAAGGEHADRSIAYVCVREASDVEIVQALEEVGFVQDPDVLDTWFSSGLWPLSTMGWPTPDAQEETRGLLEKFNPTSVLVTGRDIITLWVSRMVMFNRFFNHGKVPFRHVYINSMIQDGHGQRMSKSLGNGVDPRDIVRSHGADALRFTLMQVATSTQDCRMPVDAVCPHCDSTIHPKEITSPAGYRVAHPNQECGHCGKGCVTVYGEISGSALPTEEAPLARNTSSQFDIGRNFANKLWNAARFALSHLDLSGGNGSPRNGGETALADLPVVDRWIISRLHKTLHEVEDALREYQLSAYAEAMYDFVRRDFCDWYLEAIKPTVRTSPAQQQVLRAVLDATLRMLHPICPFVTEALWPYVAPMGIPPANIEGLILPNSELLAGAAWPDIACRVHDQAAISLFERLQSLVNAINSLRGEHHVKSKKRITLHVTPSVQALIADGEGTVETRAGLGEVQALEGRPADAIPFTFEGEELFLAGLVDAVDAEAERARLTKLVAAKEKAVAGYRQKLANSGYVNNAPPEVVDETRQRQSEAEADLTAARKALAGLDGARGGNEGAC